MIHGEASAQRCGTALSPSEVNLVLSCGAATGAGGAVAVFVPPTAAEKKNRA